MEKKRKRRAPARQAGPGRPAHPMKQRSMIRHDPADLAHWKRCADSLGLDWSEWARRALNAASGRRL